MKDCKQCELLSSTSLFILQLTFLLPTTTIQKLKYTLHDKHQNIKSRFFSYQLLLTLLVIAGIASFITSCGKRSGMPRVLVFSKTSGWHHSSIPNGIAAITKLGEENKFVVDTTTDGSYFHEDSLKNYSAVVFLSTTEES
jgi:hypothetical protein